jgi:hypothetical protein
MRRDDFQGKTDEQIGFSVIVGGACFVAIIVLVLLLKIFG